MGSSRFDAVTRHRPAWNAGKNVGTKRPLTQKQIWAIRFHLDREGRLRDRTLFDLAIDSKLRGCDVVKIKIGDVVAGADIRNRATVIQQKTNRPVQFELTADVRATLLALAGKTRRLMGLFFRFEKPCVENRHRAQCDR